MKKILVPTILILVLTSAMCLLLSKEYSENRKKNLKSLREQREEALDTQSEEKDKDPVVSDKRLMAEDTCIVVGKNIDENEFKFRNIKGGEDKSLSFDGTTSFLTKHDGPLTAKEIMIGDIVDISFTTHDSRLLTVKQSNQTWENRNINKFTIDERGKTIQIADELFRMAPNAIIATGEKIGKLLDVTSLDTITVKGIGKDVYSIQIEKGHGYIRVSNDSYFVGGWIEIGQDIITILTEGMLIPVPEGEYDIKVTNKGYVGRETLTVKRDKETKLDLSKVEIEEVAIGHVLFTLNPDYAQLYVDGIMTDFEERVPLEYGIHSIRAELAGYKTVRANIRVGSENANISIELDEEDDNSSSSSSSERSSSSSSVPQSSASSSSSSNVTPPGGYRPLSSSSSSQSSMSSSTPSGSSSGISLPGISSSSDSSSSAGSSSSESSSSSSMGESSSSSSSSSDIIDQPAISDNRKIFVEGPQGAEVYLDGNYIGIAPCNTPKVLGSHTITLSKSGYETKSYTISVGNDGNDLTVSFSELVAAQ